MGLLTVVAIGGNSIVQSPQDIAGDHQQQAMDQLAASIADVQAAGHRVVITHGNGPQVGLELRRAELAHQHEDLPPVPLAACVALTQGGMGYQLQLALANTARGDDKPGAVSLVTLVEVDAGDPAFYAPDKPVGLFYSEQEYLEQARRHPDWQFVEDAGRGYRRVVASPRPQRILSSAAIASLLHKGHMVIAGGGGGVPVIRGEGGAYQSIDGVIDKDLTSALLATEISADLLVITTGVEKVCLNFGTPQQKALGLVSLAEMEQYLQEGHFPAGSMQPKIAASLAFLRSGGKQVIITDPAHLNAAVRGSAGTRIVP